MAKTGNNILKYAGYLRVSSPGQVDNYSLESQENAIKRFVEERGGTVVKWYTDAGESGRTTQNRDALLEMRVDARKGVFDALVCHKFDRLARNRMDAVTVKSLLRIDLGIKVFSATEPGEDSDGAMGALLEGVLESVAEYFSKNLATEVKKATRTKAEKGLYHGARRPIGFVKQDDNILIPHPSEATLVREMFELYSTGEFSFQTLAEYLNTEGHRTSRNSLWDRNKVRCVLQNKVYIGKINKRDTTYTSDHKRRLSKPQTYDGKHEPLVSDELFNRVQELTTRKAHNRVAEPQEGQYLLSELCFCAECLRADEPPDGLPIERWGKMTINRAGSRDESKNQKLYEYYRCPHKHNGKHNLAKTADIDNAVVNFLLCENLPNEWKDAVIPFVRVAIAKKSEDARLAEIEAIIERMDYQFVQGFVTDREAYTHQRTLLKIELEALKPKQDDSFDVATDIIYNFRSYWNETTDLHEKRELVKMLVERVIIEDKKITAIVLRPGHKMVFLGDSFECVDNEIVLRYGSNPNDAGGLTKDKNRRSVYEYISRASPKTRHCGYGAVGTRADTGGLRKSA